MIKRYTKEDKDAFLALARLMHQESRFRKFSFDDARLLSFAENGYCGICYKNGEAIATMLGVVSPMFFSKDLAGYELGLYVRRDHRGGLAAFRLAKDFELFCKEKGCVDINVGSSAEISTELAMNFYKKLGFTDSGFVAHKEI